jgi:site-specific DNA-methyltransferase (adenine-specific)
MFILSKGVPRATAIIRDQKNKRAGEIQHGSIRHPDGIVRPTAGYGKRAIAEYGRRGNVWNVFPAKSKKERLHPAPFPVQLAKDHVLSWSNSGGLVLDPFMGSGTTGVACVQTGRDFIGIEIDPGYFKIAERRIKEAQAQMALPLIEATA